LLGVVVVGIVALGLDYFKYGPHGMPKNVEHAVPRNFIMHKVAPFKPRAAKTATITVSWDMSIYIGWCNGNCLVLLS
jgi:hypothetical protein